MRRTGDRSAREKSARTPTCSRLTAAASPTSGRDADPSAARLVHELFVQPGPGPLQHGVVGRVPDEDVAEAEGGFAGEQ